MPPASRQFRRGHDGEPFLRRIRRHQLAIVSKELVGRVAHFQCDLRCILNLREPVAREAVTQSSRADSAEFARVVGADEKGAGPRVLPAESSPASGLLLRKVLRARGREAAVPTGISTRCAMVRARRWHGGRASQARMARAATLPRNPPPSTTRTTRTTRTTGTTGARPSRPARNLPNRNPRIRCACCSSAQASRMTSRTTSSVQTLRC